MIAASALADWTDEVIAHLAAAEAEVEALSTEIRQILTDLTKNAANRVKTLFKISQHRIEREELIDHLYAGKLNPAGGRVRARFRSVLTLISNWWQSRSTTASCSPTPTDKSTSSRRSPLSLRS